METLVPVIITAICAIFASSGFWAWLVSKDKHRGNANRLLVGLGHDRIMDLGVKYLERGYITNDEYENLYEYLYKPYKELGGNGSAERIMKQVQNLPIREHQEVSK